MMRKGISPLIAAVLLIAFTMAIASIFAQWAPELMEDAQGDTSEQAAAIQDCSQINIEVTNVDEDSQEVTMSQTAGQAGAGEVTISWFFDDGGPVQTTYSLGGETEEELENTPRESVSINPNEDDGEEVNGQTITISGDIDTAEGLEEVSLDPVDCEGASTASWSS